VGAHSVSFASLAGPADHDGPYANQRPKHPGKAFAKTIAHVIILKYAGGSRKIPMDSSARMGETDCCMPEIDRAKAEQYRNAYKSRYEGLKQATPTAPVQTPPLAAAATVGPF
jgi:hypothetical protein